mgnify:CR=1 FL=1
MRNLLTLLFLWLLAIAGKAESVQSVGVSVSDLSNPFFQTMAKEVVSQLKIRLGYQPQVIVRSSAYDVNRQIAQLEEFIDHKVDIIILVAAHVDQISPTLEKAKRTGIKIVAVDVNAQGAHGTITTDNVQAGEVACEFLAQQLGGEGNFVVINGPPVSSVLERVAGCKSVLNNYPDIKLLSEQVNGTGSYEGGLEAMTLLMESFGEIDAVFAINDPSAAGAEQAAKQAGRKGFIIGSVDGAPTAFAAIARNSPWWLGSSAQFPDQMAARAVEMAIEMMHGNMPSPATQLIPSTFIHRGNVEAFKGW